MRQLISTAELSSLHERYTDSIVEKINSALEVAASKGLFEAILVAASMAELNFMIDTLRDNGYTVHPNWGVKVLTVSWSLNT